MVLFLVLVNPINYYSPSTEVHFHSEKVRKSNRSRRNFINRASYAYVWFHELPPIYKSLWTYCGLVEVGANQGIIFVQISVFSSFYFFRNLFPSLAKGVLGGQTFVCMITHRPFHTLCTSIIRPKLIAGKYDAGSFSQLILLSRYTNQYPGLAWFNIVVWVWEESN